jgi:hypothetical protein
VETVWRHGILLRDSVKSNYLLFNLDAPVTFVGVRRVCELKSRTQQLPQYYFACPEFACGCT